MVSCGCVRIGLVTSLLLFASVTFFPLPAPAEWYVAAQAGVNFADPLRNIRGTGTLAGLDAPNFNLKTSPAYGGKVAVFPSHGLFGFSWICPIAHHISRISTMCRGFISRSPT